MQFTPNRSKSTAIGFAVLLASMVAGPCMTDTDAAQIYKWVDENGVVTFGDIGHRPAQKPSESVNIRVAEPSAGTPGKPDKTAKPGEENKPAGDKPADAKKPAENEQPKLSASEKRRLCKQARDDLAVIQSRGQLRESDGKGNTTYLTEQQKQNRIKAINKDIREYCR